MASQETTIKLRLDVDYPYPSRAKNFLYLALGIKKGKSEDYLKNARIIAKMINESPKQVMAYWFFTPYTIPDKKLLDLLNPDRHKVALHIAVNPYAEQEQLEKATNRKINYYTVHGTERLLARLLWRRKLWQSKADVPKDFPLQSFYVYPTLGIDVLCYNEPFEQATRKTKEAIAEGEVLHAHPEWLLQRGTINHRGPYYQVLKNILEVDKDLQHLSFAKQSFFRIARYGGIIEYEKDSAPTEAFLEKLADRKVDIFSFIERSWCCKIADVKKDWIKTEDNVALLQVTNYSEWWSSIGKKTRNMIRKAEKSGVTTSIVEPSEKLAEDIWRIYNETPTRQGRVFPHYGASLKTVTDKVLAAKECTFIASYFEGDFIGFIQLVHGVNIVVISQILSLQKHWDKAVNNALIAKTVEFCANKQIKYVMYGRIGNHPSLDSFKQSNNFSKFDFTRYYVPLTMKGWLAIKLRLHRPLKDTLPVWLKKPLFPLFSWASSTKAKIRSRLQ